MGKLATDGQKLVPIMMRNLRGNAARSFMVPPSKFRFSEGQDASPAHVFTQEDWDSVCLLAHNFATGSLDDSVLPCQQPLPAEMIASSMPLEEMSSVASNSFTPGKQARKRKHTGSDNECTTAGTCTSNLSDTNASLAATDKEIDLLQKEIRLLKKHKSMLLSSGGQLMGLEHSQGATMMATSRACTACKNFVNVQTPQGPAQKPVLSITTALNAQ